MIILNTKKYLDRCSNIFITFRNTISNGLIINVIKLSGYSIKDTKGTTTRLFKTVNRGLN